MLVSTEHTRKMSFWIVHRTSSKLTTDTSGLSFSQQSSPQQLRRKSSRKTRILRYKQPASPWDSSWEHARQQQWTTPVTTRQPPAVDQALQPGKLEFPTIVNNEQICDCGRNLADKTDTKDNYITNSNDNVKPTINVNNVMTYININLLTISI